ncbi:MAG: N-acetyltransferase, partial [Lachnospiraceae bacterium]
GAIHGAFFFSMAGEPNYDVIREGSWESDAPYGVLHRVARDAACHSFLKTAVAFALKTTSHLRIDTHRDNKVMQHAILSCGFSYRGIINLADGSERLAYERV